MLPRIRYSTPILCALSLLAVACAPAPSAAPAPAKEPPKAGAPAQPLAAKEPAKEAPKPAAARATWPTRITVGAGEPGTPFYGVATGWAKVLQDKLGIPTNVIAAGGSQSNVQSVQSGEAIFGLSSMNNVHEGLTGARWAQGKKTEKVRVVLPTFVQYLKCYALRDANIGKLKDFDGKVISAGPAGTQFPVYAKETFEAVGAKLGRIVNVPHGQGAELLKDRQAAGVCHIGGAPLGAVAEANLTHPLTVVSPSEVEREQILKALPFFSKAELSREFYKGYKGVMENDLPALSVYVAFIGSKDLPEDFVYEVLKITYPNVPEIAKAHRSGSEILVQAAASITSPFHKGAARYFQEQGQKLQDAAKPID
ncbi:MAG: TAXI family TRAP transporter solute-binding subunit [Chloroflexi bacterium]|nr:TAXI family TRAP transporter solute-binding subunit [Chloroflexota bacterium]